MPCFCFDNNNTPHNICQPLTKNEVEKKIDSLKIANKFKQINYQELISFAASHTNIIAFLCSFRAMLTYTTLAETNSLNPQTMTNFSFANVQI